MRNILVTGASGGIGGAIVNKFAAEGDNIVIHYHTAKARAEALAAQLSADFGVNALTVCADVADEGSVAAMFDEIAARCGSLDVLVNNAGIAQQKLFTDVTAAEWRSMCGVNLDGVFFCCQQALKRFMLPAHQGVILNISSMWGQVGASCEVPYSAAKAGVIGLTKALAKEVGLSGIRVNCLAPGVVITDMMKGFDEQTLKDLKEETPLNALGTPEQIAEAAAFLCSDNASFITGQVLGVNGGMVI